MNRNDEGRAWKRLFTRAIVEYASSLLVCIETTPSQRQQLLLFVDVILIPIS